MLIVESLENTKSKKKKKNLTFPHPHLETVLSLLPVVLLSGNLIEHTEVQDSSQMEDDMKRDLTAYGL